MNYFSRTVCSALLLSLIFLSGCANQALVDARALYHKGDYAGASDVLTDCADFDENVRLICLVEKGTVLHEAGRYKESNRFFLAANRFIKDRDFISVSEQSAASVVNDYAIVYVGEYAEQLWIHSYLMMNFLHLHDYEAARVEAKQALEVFDRYPEALEKAYFSRALIALCFELFNQFDDARIEYEIIARQSGKSVLRPQPISDEVGELVLFVSTGKAPLKEAKEIVAPPSIRISIPSYRSSSPFVRPLVQLPSLREGQLYEQSTDTFQIADQSLNDRMAAILTRQTARVAGKEAIADSFGNDELAEFLVRVALFATEQADVRSWQTLPGGFHLLRFPMEAGSHQVEISIDGQASLHVFEQQIVAGRRYFRSIRF